MSNIGRWIELSATAPFTARQDFACTVHRQEVYIACGKNGSTLYNDVWKSLDLQTWTRVTSNIGCTARSYATLETYDNKLWLMGGVDSTGGLNDVWKSENNGVTWSRVTSSAGWEKRRGHRTVVFNNKIVLMFGINTASTTLTDVWSTTNGVAWTKEKDDYSSGNEYGRVNFDAVVFKNELYVVGGQHFVIDELEYLALTSVYKTSNLTQWQSVAEETDLTNEVNIRLAVKDEHIYLAGGESVDMTDLTNQTVRTRNGAIWNFIDLAQEITYTDRHSGELINYGNRLYYIGGYGVKDGVKKALNDVWQALFIADTGPVDGSVKIGTKEVLKDYIMREYWQLYIVASRLSGSSCYYKSRKLDGTVVTVAPQYKNEYNDFPIDMALIQDIFLEIEYHGGVVGGYIVANKDIKISEGTLIKIKKKGKQGAVFVAGEIRVDDYNEYVRINILGFKDVYSDEAFFTQGTIKNNVRQYVFPYSHEYNLMGSIRVLWQDRTNILNYLPFDDESNRPDFTDNSNRQYTELLDFGTAMNLLAQGSYVANKDDYDAVLHSQSAWYLNDANDVLVDIDMAIIDLVDGTNCALDKNVSYDFNNVLTTLRYRKSDKELKDNPGTSYDTYVKPLEFGTVVSTKSVLGERISDVSIDIDKVSTGFYRIPYLLKLLAVNALPNFTVQAYGVILDDIVPIGCTISGLPEFYEYNTNIYEYLNAPCKTGTDDKPDKANTTNQVGFGNDWNKKFFNSMTIDFMTQHFSISDFDLKYSVGYGTEDKTNKKVIKDANLFSPVNYKDGKNRIEILFDPDVRENFKKNNNKSLYFMKDSPYSLWQGDLISMKYLQKYATLPLGTYFNRYHEEERKKYFPVTKMLAQWNGKDFVADLIIQRTPQPTASTVRKSITVKDIPKQLIKKKVR